MGCFDDTLKANNHISLSGNGMIGWMFRNFISREANIVLKIYTTPIRPYIEYCTRVWAPVLRHKKLECNIEIGWNTNEKFIIIIKKKKMLKIS